MKRTKKLLSFFLAIVMVIATIPAFSIVSNAATSTTLNCSAAYYMANHQAGRRNGYEITTCNDSASDNFCSGWWGGYSLSGIGNVIDSASLTATIKIGANRDVKGVEFYATNQTISGDVTNLTGVALTARELLLNKFPDRIYLGIYDKTAQTNGDNFKIDNIKSAVQKAKNDGWTNFNIIAIQRGASPSGSPWSDANVVSPTVTITSHTNGNDTPSDLDSMLTYYENLMKKGIAFKDMSTAYDYYCQIQAYKDAINYGGKDYSSRLTTLTSDFKTAISNMEKSVWTPYRGTATGKFINDTATDGYSNLLYSSSNTTTANKIEKNINDVCYGVYACKNNVLLYDGENYCGYPIVCRVYKNAGGTSTKNFHSLYVSTANSFELKRNWLGRYTNGNNIPTSWPTGTSALAYLSTESGKISLDKYTAHYYNNVCYYTGSGDLTNYYEKFTGTGQVKFKGYEGSSHGGEVYANDATQYVINYAPIIKKVDLALSTISTIGVADFKEGGLTNFFNAYDALTSLNPNSYFSSATDDNISTCVTDCADAIKTAVVNMNKIISGNQWTKDAFGYYDELRTAITKATYTTNDDCYASQAWSNYTSAKTKAINAILNPSDRTVFLDRPYYTTSYPSDSSTSIQTIAKKLEDAITALTKTAKEHNTLKFTAESGDTVSYVCASKESHSSDVKTGNIQNYNTLKMIYSTIDTGAYTDDAKTALNNAKTDFDKVLNSSVTVDVSSQTLQNYIDSKTSALLNAINTDGKSGSPAVNQYTVTFNVLVDGTKIPTEPIYANYGTVVTLDASPYVNGHTCSSWDIAIGGKTKTVAQPKNTYTILVQGNTTVTANCVSGNAVIIQDQYGNDLYVVPAAIGSPVSCSGNVVTVNSTAYTIPNMPYITINGYTANGKKVTGDVTTTESTTIIRPVSSYSTDATYTIKLDGATVASDVVYDQDVTVSTAVAGAKGIAILNGDGTYSIASYSNSYEFYANRSMDFYTVTGSNGNYTINGLPVTDKLMIFSLDNSLPFIYSASATVKVNETRSKMTTFSAYTTELPAGVTVIESGTLYSKATDLSATNFVIDSGRSDIFQKASATHIDFSNQFSLSFTTGDKVYTRGYVKYTYTYGDKQITAVAYSNICESN